MKRLFAIITLMIGIWLIISLWLLGYSATLAQWIDLAVGILISTFSLSVLLHKTDPTPTWPLLVNSILGLWLIISGVLLFGHISANEIICGILVAFFSIVATQIIEGKKCYVYTKDGGILLEMSSMTYKDGIILMKGKNFGTMPSIMHVRPVDIWNMLGLVPFNIIGKLPQMLLVGWKQSKEVTSKDKGSK
jgi:hypothetical protein